MPCKSCQLYSQFQRVRMYTEAALESHKTVTLYFLIRYMPGLGGNAYKYHLEQ